MKALRPLILGLRPESVVALLPLETSPLFCVMDGGASAYSVFWQFSFSSPHGSPPFFVRLTPTQAGLVPEDKK